MEPIIDSPDRIEHFYVDKDTPPSDYKYYVDLKDPRGKRMGFNGFSSDTYEELLVGKIAVLSAGERKIFLSKHFVCYFNRNSIWFQKLLEIVIKVDFPQKDEFLELIDGYIKHFDSIKEMSFSDRCSYVLKVLSQRNGVGDISIILGLDDQECKEIVGYLKNMQYIRLIATDISLAILEAKGRAFLENKTPPAVLYIINNGLMSIVHGNNNEITQTKS